MFSPIPVTTSLAHFSGGGGILLGIILVAAALGFAAGLFFERAIGQRRSQDRER